MTVTMVRTPQVYMLRKGLICSNNSCFHLHWFWNRSSSCNWICPRYML